MSDTLRSSFALKRQALVEQAKRVDANLTDLKRIATEQRQKAGQADAGRSEFARRYSALSKDTAAVCHDILLARSRDEWSLAFAYLANYLVAQLGQASVSQNSPVENAMIWNLSKLSEAMSKSFPERRMVMDPWTRSVEAFGSRPEPMAEKRPHPHVDSLSQVICTLRDTGPNLPFRELYAPSESGLHIVRPA